MFREERFPAKVISAGRRTIPKPFRDAQEIVEGNTIHVHLIGGETTNWDYHKFRTEVINEGSFTIPKPIIEKWNLKIDSIVNVVIYREIKDYPFIYEGKEATRVLDCSALGDGTLRLYEEVAKRLLSGESIKAMNVVARFSFIDLDDENYPIKTVDKGIQSFEIGIIEDKTLNRPFPMMSPDLYSNSKSP